jgi:hypothetical protein
MANKLGTIDLLARELGRLFQSLEEQLSEGNILTLFGEMGVEFPSELLSHTSFVNALSNSVATASQLPSLIMQLETSIEAEDQAAIASTALEILQVARDLVTFFNAIATELQNLSNELPGLNPGDVTNFAQQLASRLLEYAFVRYLEGYFPVWAHLLALFGIVEIHPEPGDSVDATKPAYIRRRFHFDHITDLFNPGEAFNAQYHWGDSTFDATSLLQRLRNLLSALAVPVVFEPSSGPGVPPSLRLFWLTLSPKTDISPPGLEAIIETEFPAGFAISIPFFLDGWTVELSSQASLEPGVSLIVKPVADSEISAPSVTVEGEFSMRLVGMRPDPDKPFSLLGQAAIGELVATGLSAGISVGFRWDSASNSAKGELRFEARLDGGKLSINPSNPDGFLSKLLPEGGLNADFDVALGLSSETGFYFNGSSALEIRIPVHIDLSVIELQAITLGAGIEDGKFPVTLGADIKANLGPLVAVVNNIGLKAIFDFPGENKGNLGPVDLGFDFKPPTGVGLSIDTGVIKGGGFLYFDPDKGEYFGALELDFKGMFSLKAIGIINTKMPDGSKGFSLLIIITAEFTPIQLGYGFVLIGVGGLLGLNRTTRIEVLREGVKTNAIKSILFPEDIVANINRIVSDLKQIFPPQADRFIIGPMGKAGWGTPAIITLELGILLEIPVPRIAILGVLKALLPEEEAALLRIQVNFLGIIDFENKYISFDASLYDSRLLVFTLTGDMALRLCWGNNPLFILSVGGFHPSFKDAPADLQNMKRLAISLLSGNNPRISIQCYFAVTSNTVQFGAKAELYAAACGFNVYGFIGFDVLFQFDPFYFIASIYAGLALRAGSTVLFSIRLRGELAGPTPWDIRGEASFSILFFEISISFHETWGDRGIESEPEKVDIIALLTDEVNDIRNWNAVIPDNNSLYVSIKKIEPPENTLIIHPFGVLTFSERLVPLNVTINKFGNKVPKDADRFELTHVKSDTKDLSTEDVKEQFARAHFIEMKDSEKLSTPSFEQMPSGFKIAASSDLLIAAAVNKSVDYELTYLRKKQLIAVFAGIYKLARGLFKAATKGSAVARASMSYQNNRISSNAPEAVSVKTEKFALANVSNMQLHGPGMVADSYTEASELYQKLISDKPELKDQVQILSDYELSMN